jgi:hypothetical protein
MSRRRWSPSLPVEPFAPFRVTHAHNGQFTGTSVAAFFLVALGKLPGPVNR